MPISVVCLSFVFEANVPNEIKWTEMFCYLLTKNKMFKLDKNNYDDTFIFYFYSLFDAQFVKYRKQLALVHAI